MPIEKSVETGLTRRHQRCRCVAAIEDFRFVRLIKIGQGDKLGIGREFSCTNGHLLSQYCDSFVTMRQLYPILKNGVISGDTLSANSCLTFRPGDRATLAASDKPREDRWLPQSACGNHRAIGKPMNPCQAHQVL